MAAVQEPYDSLRDRARRALLDNPETESAPMAPPAPVAATPEPVTAAPASSTEVAGAPDQIELRLKAIRMVRDLEPKRACYAERVRDLSRMLLTLPGDSIHYRTALDKLREAHTEWLALEEHLWAANYSIRSTQWLVDLLADPGSGTREGGADHAE